MEIFNKSGHITVEGLQALQKEYLNEFERLEVAEHLSFCDDCLLEYTLLLEDDQLIAPPTPIAPGILRKIRQKTKRIFFNKFTKIASVACFSMIIWGTGMFNTVIPARFQQQPKASGTPRNESSWFHFSRDYKEKPVGVQHKENPLQQGLHSFCSALDGLLEVRSIAPEQAALKEEQKKREEVFNQQGKRPIEEENGNKK